MKAEKVRGTLDMQDVLERFGGSSAGGGSLKSADDDYDRLKAMDKDFEKEFYKKKGKLRIGGDPSKTYHGSEKFVYADSPESWELASLFAGAENEIERDYEGGENSSMLHSKFDISTERSGFGGSWTKKYVNKRTGDAFKIKAEPNGKGFYGTDYYVSKIKK